MNNIIFIKDLFTFNNKKWPWVQHVFTMTV